MKSEMVRCKVCGRVLRDPVSVALGIGPVCRKRARAVVRGKAGRHGRAGGRGVAAPLAQAGPPLPGMGAANEDAGAAQSQGSVNLFEVRDMEEANGEEKGQHQEDER